MSNLPRVTLGVTTCNVQRYLPGALDTVLAQDFEDFEVVICDNQSDDSTWEICQQYAAKDERFRLYRNDRNIGVAANFARVVELARGEYFRSVEHDDLMAPSLLRRCVDALDANPRAALAFPRGILIDGEGGELGPAPGEQALTAVGPGRRIARLVRAWRPGYCNEVYGLMRTDVLRRTRLLGGSYVSTDRRMLVELAARGEFVLIDEALFYRRLHDAGSFGTGHGARMYEWLEPDAVKDGKVPARYERYGGDFGRLTMDTIRTLLRSELPAGDRLTSAVLYGAVWGGYWPVRRARVAVGRWRRRALAGPAGRSRPSEPVAGSETTP